MFHKLFDKIKEYKKPIIIGIILGLLINTPLSLSSFLVKVNKPNKKEQTFGTAYESGNNAQWYNYTTFTGFQTNVDPTKLPDGGNPAGQNTTINNGDKVGLRKLGYEVFPNTESISTSTNAINSLHNFRKRSGENIMMRTSSTTVEWYEEQRARGLLE